MSGPESFRTTIEQVRVRRADGLPETGMVDVVTDGIDFLTDKWSAMSARERATFNAWVEDLHDAYVYEAEQEPDIRQRATEIRDEEQADVDAEEVRGSVLRALEEVEGPRSGT